MKIQIKFVLVALLLSAFSCDKDELPGGTLNYIAYGSSFGECLGYCYEQMKLYPQQSTLIRKGWDESGTLPDIQCSLSLENYEFISIQDSLDLSKFFSLEKTYGCPDCADGGAEWVEISYDTLKHRITFEYMNEPDDLAGLLPFLRSLNGRFKGCEE